MIKVKKMLIFINWSDRLGGLMFNDSAELFDVCCRDHNEDETLTAWTKVRSDRGQRGASYAEKMTLWEDRMPARKS